MSGIESLGRNSPAADFSRFELLSIAVLLCIFFSVVMWFGNVDFYHRYFFETGPLVAADNLARTAFVVILCWLVYAPGAAAASLLMPEQTRNSLSRAEWGVLGFGIGIGLWHVVMLALGVAGLYYRSVMIGLCSIVLLLSARQFGRAAEQTWRLTAVAFRHPCETKKNVTAIGAASIAVAVVWLLLVRGLYPGTGFDYYTHYFPYLLAVIKNHSLAPNDVWYHYWYSKGYGLVFLGMLLTDPEAIALATFCYILFAAVAIATLIARIAPRSLWPACGALIYLLFNLVSISHRQGGEFQKDHEATSALIVLVAWAVVMARGPLMRPCLVMAASTGSAAAIISQPAGFVVGLYFALLAAGSAVRGHWRQSLRYFMAGALVGGVLLAIAILSYLATGLISDRSLDLTLRFADFSRLDRWGVIPLLVSVQWARDRYTELAQPFGWRSSLTDLRYFVRFDLVWLFVVAGPAVALAAMLVEALRKRSIKHTIAFAVSSGPATSRTIVFIGALLALLCLVSVFAGHSESASYENFSSFFVPLIVLMGIALCSLAVRRAAVGQQVLARQVFWFRVVLPIVLLVGTLMSWQDRTAWASRAIEATDNAFRFFTGSYSLAVAYAREGGINPQALAAWRHVEPGAIIWSFGTHSYCMVPGCTINSAPLAIKISPRLVDILAGTAQQEKQALQEADTNYFLIIKGGPLVGLLPYSPLFAADTIGRFLGIRWTDGSAFLLTWLGPNTQPIGADLLDAYKMQLSTPDRFLLSDLIQQIRPATERLRSAPWGSAPDFVWRHPIPDQTAGFNVLDATYGRSCRTARVAPPAENLFVEGNVTWAVRSFCRGKTECSFLVVIPSLVDPAPGCAKDFSVTYQCPAEKQSRTITIPAAADGKTAVLDCAAD
jgi:hypothetical protein